jgi:translation elongation factor aEF-1 beta
MEYNIEARIKVYIEDPKSIPNVKSHIEKLVKVVKFWEEDVGFGIKALKAVVLMNDSEGGMDQLEEKIRGIEHVGQFEVESVSRV